MCLHVFCPHKGFLCYIFGLGVDCQKLIDMPVTSIIALGIVLVIPAYIETLFTFFFLCRLSNRLSAIFGQFYQESLPAGYRIKKNNQA